jgi:hypothetical protein
MKSRVFEHKAKFPKKGLLVTCRSSEEECIYYFYIDGTYACYCYDDGTWTISPRDRSQWEIKNGLFYYKHNGQSWHHDGEHDEDSNAKNLIKVITDALAEHYLLGSAPSDTK